MAILAVNAGSSSLKFSLHPLQGTEIAAATLIGSVQGLEPGGTPCMRWRESSERGEQSLPGNGHGVALDTLRDLIAARHPRGIQAVAHRVVHGGRHFREPVMVTEEVLTALSALDPLAPLHQPHNVAGIRAFRSAFPDTPQVACFDTAFHATVPDTASRFALPRVLHDEGIRRYGFHGLSYEYIMSCLLGASRRARGRVLMAHLGNGASLCAAVDGRSQATTMGFSALDGLMMGTRSGTLDAGVLLYLMQRGWDHDRLQTLLYRQSGLLGVSGLSADMRTLRAAGRIEAGEAIALFTHRVVREAGAMAACIGGLDVIAFSGGIGEHDALLRADVCAALAWMGVGLDASRNVAADGSAMMRIDDAASGIEVWVVPTDEGRVAARGAARLLAAPG